jgi:hypothetical protein
MSNYAVVLECVRRQRGTNTPTVAEIVTDTALPLVAVTKAIEMLVQDNRIEQVPASDPAEYRMEAGSEAGV